MQLQERQRDVAKLRAADQRPAPIWMGAGIALAVVLLGMVLAALLVRSITQPWPGRGPG